MFDDQTVRDWFPLEKELVRWQWDLEKPVGFGKPGVLYKLTGEHFGRGLEVIGDGWTGGSLLQMGCITKANGKQRRGHMEEHY